MPLCADHFLPPLLQCTQLRGLALGAPTLSLSAAQPDGLTRLPLLEALSLIRVEVESVAPLTHATKLLALYLLRCRGPPAVVDFRRSLPRLPSLTFLELDDRSRLTAEQAAPLNAALLARMPQLTPPRFHQNLLAE